MIRKVEQREEQREGQGEEQESFAVCNTGYYLRSVGRV